MSKITLLIGGLVLSALTSVAGPPSKTVVLPASTSVEFVANLRQWDQSVLFAANVPGGRLFLTAGQLVQTRYDVQALEEVHHHAASATATIKAHAYAVTFVGANAQATVRGEEQRSAHTNFFLGNDPSRWASNVPAYGAVRYQALYPNTDLRFYTHDDQVEYDFEIAPGADIARIRMRYDGQQSLFIRDGALHVSTSVGTVVEQRPFAYQLYDGRREAVPCEYVLGVGHTVSFALPKGYDHHRPLVIDPVLVYSTYSASAASNWGYSSTYDTQGNLYCGGISFAQNFPLTMGAYDITFAGSQDMAIMKYNPASVTGPASLLYSTFIGGSQAEHPHSMLVDAADNLLIYGSTNSTNYPVTTGAYDTSFNGAADIVVSRLNSTGSALLASTFIGGTGIDGQLPITTGGSVLFRNFGDGFRGDLALDRAGNVYVASNSQSSNFPYLLGFQNALSGARDAVVFKLAPSLGGLQWSTFLGGSNEDAAYSIQVDSVNNVFVCGGTASTDFPGTAGGIQPAYNGSITDGFVARISAAGDDLVQSSYLGTNAYDQAYFVQLDRQGQVYILGQTDGFYPVSAGVYNNPSSRQFIHKMRPTLTASTWSTVIGNGRPTGAINNISPTAFLIDNCGQILLSGYGANIANMPITQDALKRSPTSTSSTGINGDFYIMQLSANAGRLVYGTYFGDGTLHVDGGASRFDKSGVIYQTVCAGGGGFSSAATTTANAWGRAAGTGARNALSFKIDVLQLNANFIPAIAPLSTIRQRDLCAPATFYFNRPAVAGTSTLWNFGNGMTSTLTNGASTTYQNPGRYPVRLTVFDVNSCLQSVTSVDTVVVYPVPQPRAAATGGSTICTGSSVTLLATNSATNTPNVTYTWTAPGQTPQTGSTITVRPTTTTTYTVTVATPACSATDAVTVTVLSRLQVSAGPARDICGGAATTLRVADFGPNSTYTWTAPGQPTVSGSSNQLTVSPPASIRYTVAVVNGNGCQGRDSVQLNVAPRPTVAATASAPNLMGKPVSFTNTSLGATAYRWNFGDASADSVSTDVNPTHVYERPSAGYRAKLTAFYGPNGSCQESKVLLVPVRGFDLPNVITPNADGKNDTFRPFVSVDKVNLQIFNRWGRLVYEQNDYTDGWGSSDTVAAGVYYYRIVSASGESWKGWVEVVK